MPKIAIEIDCEGVFCERCEKQYIHSFSAGRICSQFNKTLEGEIIKSEIVYYRCPQCIAAELKAGDE